MAFSTRPTDLFSLLLSCCIVTFCGDAILQASTQETATSVVSVSQEKALKYHKTLQRRPAPGYLYDRFYDTWLETSSIEELESFLKKKAQESTSTKDQLLLAFFYAKQSEDVRALEQFRLALANDPTNAATLYEKAAIEARTLDFDTALADLEKAAAANPKPADAIKIAQLQGKLLVRNRQNDEAIKVWSKLIKANPDDTNLMEDVIELQITEGLFDEAEKLSDTLISKTKDPYQKVMRQLRKGDVFLRAGKRKQALDVYGSTLEKVGMDSWLEREILGQIEQLFRREDDLVGLKAHYDTLMKTESKRMAIRKSSARILLELGMEEEAIKTFEEIVKLTPGDRGNREAFINLLARTEKLDLAIKQTNSLIEQYPKDAELQIKLAELNSKSGNKEAVNKAIEAFLSVSEETEYAFLRGARLLERFDSKEKAELIYVRAVQAFPESDAAKESQAAFLYGYEKKDQALAIWNAIAAKGDRSQLVRIARVVSSRQEPQAAFDMLFARFDELKLDTIFLGQLCNESLSLKKIEDAVPWALSRVRLSKTKSELDSCLAQAVRIVSQSEQNDKITDELLANAKRKTSTTCLVAELLERSNRGTEAEKLLKTALETVQATANDATNDQVQMLSQQRVRLYSTRQDWESAAIAAKELVELPGGRKSVNLRQLVDLYIRARDFDPALHWIGEWKKASPGSLIPWLNESSVYEQMGEYKDSINVLRIATQKFPKDSDLFAQLGDRYLSNGQYKDAERIFWRQYEESEKLGDKLRWSERLADLSDDTGQMDQLIEKLEERKKNNPNSVDPLIALAQAHRIADNYEERRMALLEASRIQKNSLPILLEIARMEESEGDWEKAILTLEEAAKQDKTTRAKEQIARLYIQFGESKEGFSRLLELAGGQNSSARDVESVVDAIIATEDFEQARDFLLPQMARFENDFRLKFQLATINEELDFVDKAVQGFVDLLDVKTELKKFKKPKNPMAGYMDKQLQQMRGIVSPETGDLLEISMLKDIVFSYGNSRGGMFGASSGSQNYWPSDARECRMHSVCHLVRLSESMNDDERKSLMEQARAAGVSNTELIFDEEFSLDGNGPGALVGLLEDHPDNESALGLVMFMAIGDQGTDVKVALKGYETFKDRYPVLSFFGAMQAAGADKANNGELAESLKGMEDIEKPNSLLVMAIARFTGAGGMFGQQSSEHEISTENISKLNGLLLKWYPKIQADPNMGGWMTSMVANSLKQDETPERFLQLLEELIAKSKDKSQSQMGGSISQFFPGQGFGRGQGESLVVMPAFPPSGLVSFPQSVLNLVGLQSDAGRYDPFGNGDEEEDPDEWVKKFSPAIGNVKDPILKTLLQMKVSLLKGEDEDKPANERMVDAKATLDALLKSQPPNQDAFYLAASLAMSEQRWADASNLFEKMRNLPMSKTLRQQIDGHLVAIAIQGVVTDLKSTANKPVLDSAKAAALRLRRIRLSTEQRTELVSVFETLELKEEAEKMESKLAQAGNALFGGMFGSRGGRGNVTPMAASGDRVRDLADTGKSDAAARLLVQEFRGLARGELALNTMNNNQYELQELSEKIKSNSLREEFLKQVSAGESGSATKVATQGLAEELFGDKELAQKLYTKSLESSQKQDAVRLRLMLLELPTKPEAFKNHFAKIQKRSRPAAGQALANSFNRRSQGADEVLGIVEQVTIYLGSLEKDAKGVEWIGTVLSQAGGQLQITERGGYLSSIFQIVQKDEEDSEDEDEEVKESASEKEKRELEEALTTRRAKLHDELARMTIDFPALASEGFTALLGSTEAQGKPIGDEFVEMAITAVIPPKSTPAMGTVYYSSGQSYSWSEEGEEVVQRTPSEFLAKHFGMLEGDSSAKIDEIVKKLETAKAKDEASELLETYRLYKSSPESYAKTATDYLEKVKKNRRSTISPGEVMSKVVEVWGERKGLPDISELILAQLDQPKSRRQPYGYSSDEYFAGYAVMLGKSGDLQKTRDFVKQYRTKLLGTPEEQTELIELVKKMRGSGRMSGSNSQRYQSFSKYQELIQGLSRSTDTMFFALSEASELKMENIISNSQYSVSNKFGEFKKDEAVKLLDWLGTSKLLADVDEFDPFYNLDTPSDPSVWGGAVSQLSYRASDELIEGVTAELKKKEKLTFGEQILIKGLNGKLRKKQEVYDLFGEHLEAIKALPAEKQTAICLFANQVIGSTGGSSAKMSPNGELAKTFIASSMGSSMKSEVEKLMTAKRISDLELDEYEVQDWVSSVLKQMDKSEPEKIATALFKVAGWLEKPNQNRYYGGRESARASLVEEALSNFDLESLPLLLTILEAKDEKCFVLSDDLSRELSGFVDSEFEKAMPEEGDDRYVLGLDKFNRAMGESLGDRDISCLIPTFQTLLVAKSGFNLDRVEKWATMESKSGKYKQLATAWRLAVPAARAADAAKTAKAALKLGEIEPKFTRLEALAAHQSELLGLIEDENRTLSIRLLLATSLIEREKTMAAEGVFRCAETLQAVLKKDVGLDSNTVRSVFRGILECETDDAFKEKGAAFGKAWVRNVLSPKSQQRGYFDYEDTLVPAIKLFTKTDNRAMVSQLIRKFADRVQSKKMVATLIESGYGPDARKLCLQMWSEPGGLDLQSNDDLFYTAELHKSLPPFVRLFQEDGQKLLAETFFASLKDPKDETKKHSVDKAERLNKLAARYPEVSFGSKSQNQIVLVLLAQAPDAAKTIQEPLRLIAEKIAAKDLLDDNNRTIGFNLNVKTSYIGLLARGGDFEPLEKLMVELNKEVKDASDWQFQNTMEGISDMVSPELAKAVASSTPEELESLLSVISKLNDPALDQPFDQGLNVLVHVLSGKTDALVKQFESAKDQDDINISEVWGSLTKYIDSQDGFKSDELRIQTVKDVWLLGAKAKFSLGSDHFTEGVQESCSGCRTSKYGLDSIEDLDFLTAEEMLVHGASLAESNSVEGEIWLQLGRRQFKAKQFEEAAESFKKAIDGSTKKMKQAKTNRTVEYMQALSKLGRDDEAKKLLESVDSDKLLGDNKQTFKDLKAKYTSNRP